MDSISIALHRVKLFVPELTGGPGCCTRRKTLLGDMHGTLIRSLDRKGEPEGTH